MKRTEIVKIILGKNTEHSRRGGVSVDFGNDGTVTRVDVTHVESLMVANVLLGRASSHEGYQNSENNDLEHFLSCVR